MPRRLTRRLACAAVLLQIAIAPAWAQAADDEGIGFGVKGGVVRANYSFSENQDLFNPATGWIIGAFGGGNRAGRLGWQGELNFVRKSTRCGCNQEVVDLYYVQIPALLRANFADRERDGLTVYGLVGPALELKVGERLGSRVITRYRKYDVALVLGGGVEFGRYLVEARGTWGLANLGTHLIDDFKITSRTFAILGGFRFN